MFLARLGFKSWLSVGSRGLLKGYCGVPGVQYKGSPVEGKDQVNVSDIRLTVVHQPSP